MNAEKDRHVERTNQTRGVGVLEFAAGISRPSFKQVPTINHCVIRSSPPGKGTFITKNDNASDRRGYGPPSRTGRPRSC